MKPYLILDMERFAGDIDKGSLKGEAMFEEKGLTIQAAVVEETEQGPIIEFILKGKHDHSWPYGEKIRDFIKEKTQTTNSVAVIFNFLDYHYEFGNELGGPILEACIDRENKAFRPFAIVADGMTAKRIKSFFAHSNLDRVAKYEFCEDHKTACTFLKETLAEGFNPD